MKTPHPFLHDQRGMSGAEKALLVCFGLGIVILTGALISNGSNQAAGDAKSALLAGGHESTQLGQVLTPGAIATAGTVASSGAIKGGDMPLPRPQPGKAAPLKWKDADGREFTRVENGGYVSVWDKNDVHFEFSGGQQKISFDKSQYWFTPGPDGKWQKVTFQVNSDSGPFVAHWIKKGDSWVMTINDKEQRTYKGKYPPDTWPDLVWNKDKIVKIAEASEKNNADIREAIGKAWKETFKDDWLSAISLPAKVMGLGLSTGPNKLKWLTDESAAIDKLHTDLKKTIKDLKAAKDPESIAELTEKFIKEDNQLRGKLQKFADESKTVLKNTEFIATVHGIAGDVYSLGGRSLYGGGTIAKVWEGGGALKDVYGLGKGIYKLDLDWSGGDPGSAINKLPQGK